jgi:hypothetical protein
MYDWNLFPFGAILRSRRSIGAPQRVLSAVPAIGHSLGDLLLAAMTTTTARFRGEAIDEVALHKAVRNQSDTPFGVTDLAFDLYNGGHRSKVFSLLAKQ